MADLSQLTFSNAFSWMEKFVIRFVTKGPIDIKSTLVQEMAYRQTGDKP